MNKRWVGNCSFALVSALLLTNVHSAAAQTITESTEPILTSLETPAMTELDQIETTATDQATTNQTVTDLETSLEASALEASAEPLPMEESPLVNQKDLVILHTNDIHGRMKEEKGKDGSTTVLGMAKLDSLVESERAKTEQETFLFDAGDAFQGLPISNISKGEEMAKLMNEVGYDAMAVGNHEFDFGLDQLKKIKSLLTFPLLSSNTYVDGARLFDASTIIDRDQQVLGDELVVIGVTTPETATKTHPNNIQGVTFKDPLKEVMDVIREIEGKAQAEGKVYQNYVILGHLGIDGTTPEAWRGNAMVSQLLADPSLASKNIVYIDGHSHTVLTNQLTDKAVYQQTGTNLNNVGKITLSANAAIEAELIKASEAGQLAASPTVEAQVNQIDQAFKEATSDIIVENNSIQFVGIKDDVRTRQTNLGDAIADAMYDYSQTGFAQPSDLAVTNGGGIRASIEAGKDITEYDVISVLPFGNIIAQVEVTGQHILDMFLHALDAPISYDEAGNPILVSELADDGINKLEAAGHFLHIAGAKVYYDGTATSNQNRQVTVEVFDQASDSYQALDLKRIYRLTTNDFLAVGGDGYTMLGGARSEGPSLDTVFANYLKKQIDLAAYQEAFKYDRVIPYAFVPSEEDPAPVIPDPDNDPATEDTESESTDTVNPDQSLDLQGENNHQKDQMSPEQGGNKTPSKDKDTLDSNKDDQASTPSAPVVQAASSLPQTGESNQAPLFYGSALAILMGLGLVAASTKKEDH